MIDEQQIRQHFSGYLAKGETLKYISIPKQYSKSYIVWEIFKSILSCAGIAMIVFLAVWAKHNNFEAAKSVASLGLLLLIVVLVIHSIFHYKRNLRTISAITDQAILCLEFKGAVKNLNAVSVSRTGESKLLRVEFNAINQISLHPNSDGTGSIIYFLKGMERHREVNFFSVADMKLARAALPSTLISAINSQPKNIEPGKD